jgi:hypothetical protein
MAGPCGCKGAGCGCCFIENPSSGVPYSVFGSGESGDCVSIDIENIVTTLVDNGDGTLTYTNEIGNSVTFFDGEHYSVDVIGELAGNTTIPNVVVGTETPYGAANPLTVTIVNPSAVLDMSVHTSGTGEEVLLVGAQTAANSQYVSIGCLYSLDGAAAITPKRVAGSTLNPLRTPSNGHTGAHGATGFRRGCAAWRCVVYQVDGRRYIQSAALNAGSVVSQGQKIAISGSTTV